MAEKKTITTYGEQTAQRIKDYVDRNEPVGKQPSNPIGGKQSSTTHTFAKITSSATVSGAVQHAWTEVRWNTTTKDWENTPDGKSGTTSANYVINSADAATALDTNTIIEVKKCIVPDTGATFWVGGSSASLPTGQYQYMAYVMTSNNQAGWDFIRLHPPV